MRTITEKTIIKNSPEEIWNFLTNLHQDGNYKKWHSSDHKSFSLRKGSMGKVGGVASFKERIGKFTLKLSYTTTKAEYPYYLEYRAIPPLSWLRFGKVTFKMEPINSGATRFISYVEYGYNLSLLGKLLDIVIDKIVNYQDICNHIHEESVNIKAILEE